MEVPEILKNVVDSTFQDLGHNAEQFRAQINHFLESISPDVNKAMAAGDQRSLTYLKARAEGRLTRTSLGLIHKEQQVFLTAILTALRVLMMLK